MEQSNRIQDYQAGDIVYVFYRNPHTQDVANIQAAAVVNHPEKENELALFLYETYYPLSDEVAIYKQRKKPIKPIITTMGTLQKGYWNE